MQFGTRTYKFLVVLLNILLGILGSLLTWYGAWLGESVESPKFDHGEELSSIVIITLGVVLMCSAIYGCVVTLMELKGMLVAFTILLIILMVMQIIIVSVSYMSLNNGVADRLQQGFEHLWDSSQRGPNTKLSFYEEWLHCCGKNSAEDYFLLDKYPPASCCRDHNCTIIHNLYTEGCEDKYRHYVKSKTHYLNVLSSLIIVNEFIGSIFVCVLIDSIRLQWDLQRFL